MGRISIGGRSPKRFMLGDRPVKALYKGAEKLWPHGVELPDPGDPFMGGFFIGVIDTTQSNIIPGDAYQTGLRYALIDGGAAQEYNGVLAWRTTNANVPAAKTRWNGLAAQQALVSATFPAFQYCAGLSYPDDGGSEWYLPALDEQELRYRVMKPDTAGNNTTADTGSTFPGGTQAQGYNPSSDPAGAAYTSSVPGQTSIAAYQSGGAQAFTSEYYWTATWYNAAYAWRQHASAGIQYLAYQSSYYRVRPVRRVQL